MRESEKQLDFNQVHKYLRGVKRFKRVYTLGRNKVFEFQYCDAFEVKILVGKTETETMIQVEHLEKIVNSLNQERTVTLKNIQKITGAGERTSSYMAALLALYPKIQFKTKPITLYVGEESHPI